MDRLAMSRYELRVLLWSWGLMVDIGLDARAMAGHPSDGVPVSPGAWLAVQPSVTLWEGDLPPLLTGLRRVAPRFCSALREEEGDIVFVLDHLWYPLTDSQDDALELAVAAWAAEFLGMDEEPAQVSFDRATNRYLIQFNEQLWRPS